MRSNRRRSFTLIELLVVTAVISILTSLLLPALGKARKMANATVCINNEKQCSVALTLYADASNEFYPAGRNDYGDYEFWGDRMVTFDYMPEPAANASSILVCPGYDPFTFVNYRQTYGLWNGTDGVATGESIKVSPTACYIDRSRLRTDRILLADCTRAGYNVSWLQSYYLQSGTGTLQTEGATKSVHLRHSRKANALFGDGSVRVVDQTWIAEDARYDYSVRE